MEAYIEAHSDGGPAPADSGVLVTDLPQASKRSSLAGLPVFHSVVPFGARPAAPAILWVLGCAAALTAGMLSRPAAVFILLVAAAVVVTNLRGSPRSRAATALALAPAAFGSGAPSFAWVLAGGAVAAVAASRSGPVILRAHDLRRHIDWCRRRQEQAHVLVMRVAERDLTRPSALMDSFRLTDSVTLTVSHGTCELQAVIDGHDFSREGLERRLCSDVGSAPAFGWAMFPADGVTLDVLIGAAREDLPRPGLTRSVARVDEGLTLDLAAEAAKL